MVIKIIKNIKKWFKRGSNFIDLLVLTGLTIIVSTTFYINMIIGFYLLGSLLIIMPSIFYVLTSKVR